MNVCPKQYLIQKGVVKGYVYYDTIYLTLKRYQLLFTGIHRCDHTIVNYMRMTITPCRLVVTPSRDRGSGLRKRTMTSTLFAMFYFLNCAVGMWGFITFPLYFCATDLFHSNEKKHFWEDKKYGRKRKLMGWLSNYPDIYSEEIRELVKKWAQGEGRYLLSFSCSRATNLTPACPYTLNKVAISTVNTQCTPFRRFLTYCAPQGSIY